MNRKYYVYILECSDKTLYIGKTIDIENRIASHNGIKKGGAKYTSGRRPVVLKYFEKLDSETMALQREWELKKLTRKEKKELILKGQTLNSI